MVEGARLESVYTGNRIKGSNPFLSAISIKQGISVTTPPCFIEIHEMWDENDVRPQGQQPAVAAQTQSVKSIPFSPPFLEAKRNHLQSRF